MKDTERQQAWTAAEALLSAWRAMGSAGAFLAKETQTSPRRAAAFAVERVLVALQMDLGGMSEKRAEDVAVDILTVADERQTTIGGALDYLRGRDRGEAVDHA